MTKHKISAGTQDYRILRHNYDCEFKFMDLAAAGLQQQPFPTQGDAPANVEYASQQEALKVLQEIQTTSNSLGLLQGPSLSGKSTVIQSFLRSLPDNTAVAVVDGTHLNTTGLLEVILRQFGYVMEHGSVTELLAMLRVFAIQQAVTYEPPLLILENTHELNPIALRSLCELASLKTRNNMSALKMVLVSERSLLSIIETPPMAEIRKRVSHDFHLRPMTYREATEFLHHKLRMAGCSAPEFVFPTAVCIQLWRSSGGWLGILNRIAMLTLAKAETLPATVDLIENPTLPEGTWHAGSLTDNQNESKAKPEPPTLYVSFDGEVLQELTMEKPRILIGRSNHNDISVPSKFVSQHHAMLVRSGDATILMDLNSINGVFVNSKRVSNHFLVHDDVISVGYHRIKFVDPYAVKRESSNDDTFSDTAVMKSLDDMRNLLAEKDPEIPPSQSENLPTLGV
jgi:type II secretory pathway predicted ATPase ExeA/pSer/pThr/pTyr-binding forkhead associated (FHA) protein